MVDPSKCSGCLMCELSCSYFHEKVFSRSLSRIRVVTYDALGLDYPVSCQSCEPAPCVELCPTGALSEGPAGGIALDKSKCIGCRVCVEVCPYGAAFMEPRGRYPLICDMCGGEPRCVLSCPTNALSVAYYEEVSAVATNQTERFALEQLSRLAEGWGVRVNVGEAAGLRGEDTQD